MKLFVVKCFAAPRQPQLGAPVMEGVVAFNSVWRDKKDSKGRRFTGQVCNGQIAQTQLAPPPYKLVVCTSLIETSVRDN